MEVPSSAAIATAFAALVGGGGIGAWLRERRLGKGQQSQSMLDFVREWGDQFRAQNTRIDEMNREIGKLEGRLMQMSAHNQELVTENAALKSEVMRLETALHVETSKATALAAIPRSGRSTDLEIDR